MITVARESLRAVSRRPRYGTGPTVAGKHRAAALIPLTEAIGPAAGRLADREIWSGTRRRRLSFLPWQRRSDQRAMHGTFFGRVV